MSINSCAVESRFYRYSTQKNLFTVTQLDAPSLLELENFVTYVIGAQKRFWLLTGIAIQKNGDLSPKFQTLN